MKALVLRQHGGLENLEVVTDHPMPVLKDGHVIIRVGASSFNYHDVFTVKGMPGIKVPTNYFGIFIPKGVPADVVATVQAIWAKEIASSDALRKYATSRGALFAPVGGDAALAAAMPAIAANAWLMQDTGKAKVSPDKVGIARP